MRAMYHNGDIILALTCDQARCLIYEMATTVHEAAQTIITHKHLAKAYKDPEQKRLHRNAHRRAITRHAALKKLREELEATVKKAINYAANETITQRVPE